MFNAPLTNACNLVYQNYNYAFNTFNNSHLEVVAFNLYFDKIENEIFILCLQDNECIISLHSY